jgi:photosystem II stability/assembly factor-like uncharacterized protein
MQVAASRRQQRGNRMSGSYTILVGTVGNGIWRSQDGGATFAGVRGISDLDLVVRGFGVDPHQPGHVVAGVKPGVMPTSLLESHDGGATWAPVPSSPPAEVWCVTFDPVTPGRYFAGTCPAGLYRTDDGGQSFRSLDVTLASECPEVRVPRITSIVVYPADPRVVFATVEVDGVRRSADGGDTWQQVMTNIATPVQNAQVYGQRSTLDCHFSGISMGDPALVLVSTPDGLYASADLGETWADFPVRQVFPAQYHRELAIKLDDPDTIFQGAGEAVNGQDGVLLATTDRGQTWDAVDLPDICNSPVWCFAQHASDPDLILAATHKGMLFGTADGGATWTKLRREFSEIRGMCWLPA